MTNKELQELLKGFPDDMRVFTRGYEDGFVDPVLYKRNFALNVYGPSTWYYGPHMESARVEKDEGKERIDGLYLG